MERTYKIDFFQLAHVATPETPTMDDAFTAMQQGEIELIHAMGGYTRDVWGLHARRRPQSFAGQFRKFRTADLPEVGEAGGAAEELDLEEGQGLVERNFFVYYPDRRLIGWHTNGHASSPRQFARFLSEVLGTKVSVDPILQPDAVRRLMSGGIDATEILFTVARPRNPDHYPNDDFSRSAVNLMGAVDADSMHLKLRVDARRADTAGKLGARAKRLLRDVYQAMDVTTARAKVIEDGIEYPVDLIADRVVSQQTVEGLNTRYPSARAMFELIDTARGECEEAINEYFGELGNGLA